jgi:hypothetical protein
MLLAEKMKPGVDVAEKRGSGLTFARQQASGIASLLFFLVVTAILIQGWTLREHHLIEAEHGIGYLMGIVGGSMMLLLLLYPLRKRIAALAFLGPIKHLFRLHMIFGVLGPTLIVFHSNFQWGALNSNVALFCMLIVAFSGLLGRYIYSRIHNGLYGSQLTVQQLQDESKWSLGQLVEKNYFPQLEQHLRAYEVDAKSASNGLLSPVKIPLFTIKSVLVCRRLVNQCKRSIHKEVEDKKMRRLVLLRTRVNLRNYFGAVRRIAEFSFYQRMFAFWHVLHLPLFVMMIITGIVHVIAVHMY